MREIIFLYIPIWFYFNEVLIEALANGLEYFTFQYGSTLM